MIKDNQAHFNRLHVVFDALITLVSYIAAWFIRIILFGDTETGVLPMETYFAALYFIVPGYLIIYYMMNLYRSKRNSSAWREGVDVIRANIMGLITFFVILYIVNQPNFSRSMIMIFAGINSFLMILMRRIVRGILRTFRKKGYNLKHILLVGYSRATEQYIDRILANPEWGYMVCGILDNTIPAGTVYRDIKVLGTIGNLDIILPENAFRLTGVQPAEKAGFCCVNVVESGNSSDNTTFYTGHMLHVVLVTSACFLRGLFFLSRTVFSRLLFLLGSQADVIGDRGA